MLSILQRTQSVRASPSLKKSFGLSCSHRVHLGVRIRATLQLHQHRFQGLDSHHEAPHHLTEALSLQGHMGLGSLTLCRSS
ncbi:MAG: hypothetical protein ACK559_16175 [bacterium]